MNNSSLWDEWGWLERDENGELQCEADVGVSQQDKLFRFIVHGVLLNTCAAAGLAGNVLAAAVLRRMRGPAAALLLALAAADCALIVASVLLFGLSALYPYTGRLRHYYYHICPRLTPFAFPFALVAQTASVYLTLALTAERWLAVCRPLVARTARSPARARLAAIGAVVFALLYNAPKFLEARVYRRGSIDGEHVFCVTASDFRSPLYVTVYIHWMYLVVMYFVPFSALAVMNARIAVRVRRAAAERARLSRGARRELGLASMLLGVVLVFFLCNLLPLVTNTYEAFYGGELAGLDPLVKVSNLLVMLNSSVNFLIYVTFGEKFRRVFLKMFCGGGPRRDRGTRGGRDSPEQTRDDSVGSCVERVSLRASSRRAGRPRRALPTDMSNLSEVAECSNGHADTHF